MGDRSYHDAEGYRFRCDFRFRQIVRGDVCVCRGVFWSATRVVVSRRCFHRVAIDDAVVWGHRQGHDRCVGRRYFLKEERNKERNADWYTGRSAPQVGE